MKTITKHYIGGAFVESHGLKVMESLNPANKQVIGSVLLGDEVDARLAIFAARRAFATFGLTTKEERSDILRRLHEVISARISGLTGAMVEEYGGTLQFSSLICKMAAASFLHAEKALQDLPLVQSWGKTRVSLEPVGVAGLITAWNSNALFICLKLASAIAAGCTVVIKPSEMSALQTQVLLECFHDAKLPAGICNVVTGLGDTVGAELVRSVDVDRKSTRLNSSHDELSRMPSSA